MNTKKRLEELERRVRELEARPITYPVIIVQPAPAAPAWPAWGEPFYVGPPQITWTIS